MLDNFFEWVIDHAVGVVITVVIVIVVILMVRPIDKATNIRTIEGVVTDKVVKSDKYMVFVDDGSGEVMSFEVTDSLLRGRFNSSDTWGNIEVNRTYIFEIGGSRWEIFSCYPNIYSAKEKIE